MKLAKLMMASGAIAAASLATPVAAAELTTVNMINPLPRSANFYPLIAGEALGYFEEEGIKVHLLPSDTSIPYVAFIQNGQADLAMLDPVETLNAVIAGADINIVYEVMQNAPEGIAVSADSDVQSMADLKGTTVGLVTDRDRAFMQAALATAGLTLDDVDTVVVGEAGPTLANAFRRQTVSAIAGAVPDWLAIQANGIGVRLITPEELLASPANNFAINADMVEEKRDAIEGFLRAWSKGMYVAEVDPDILAAMAKKAVPEEWENEQFGREFLDASIGMNVSVTDRPGDLQTQVWTDLQPRMLSAGAIDKEVPVSEFLNDTYIAAANDWSREEVAAEVRAWAKDNM